MNPKLSVKYFLLFLFVLSFALLGFIQKNEPFFEAKYSMFELPISKKYQEGLKLGKIDNEKLDEISGIAVSRYNEKYLYVHNDSGDKARLFLINAKGKDILKISLEKAQNIDWEDIAIGPGPEKNINYIYVADIGDNKAKRSIKTIYRFAEPKINDLLAEGSTKIKINDFDSIQFKYPDGIKDAESIMIDPITKDIYVLSKREMPIIVYRAKYPQSTNSINTLEKVCSLPFQWAVAADFNAKGDKIMVKNYFEAFLWERNTNETVYQAFKKPPLRVSLANELQGESIAFCPKTDSYYTLSEKSKGDEMPHIFKYKALTNN